MCHKAKHKFEDYKNWLEVAQSENKIKNEIDVCNIKKDH